MGTTTEKKICVIGGGRWGQNHIKTLFEMGNLGGIVESNQTRLNELIVKYPVKGFLSVLDAMKEKFDGFVVATPAETHFEVGKKLLENGYNTLIEKPLTLSSAKAAELVETAKRNNVNLMVGHILLFHSAIRKIKEVVDSGKLGKLYYIYSTRLNLGTVRTEENVFWSFAPHDISVIDYIVGKPSTDITASGSKFLQGNIDDMAIAHLKYPDNINAHIFVSWLHPFKEQRLVVIGSKGMLSFEDSSEDKKIIFYNKRIDWNNGIPAKFSEADEFIEYEKSAPLRNELEYFIEKMDSRIEIADGKSGYEVVKVLEKVDEFLKCK